MDRNPVAESIGMGWRLKSESGGGMNRNRVAACAGIRKNGADNDLLGDSMQLTISSIDYAPEELYEQTPIVVDLVRQIPGDDRPDYWLGTVQRPIRYIKDNHERSVTHLILAARWAGTQISPGAEQLPVGIAFVMDSTLIDDAKLDLKKCDYVAIGISSETSGGKSARPLTSTLAGRIGRAFGLGKTE